MSMSPGPAATSHIRKADGQQTSRSTTPATDASSASSNADSRGTSAEHLAQLKHTAHAQQQTPPATQRSINTGGVAPRSRPHTPPAQAASSGSTQLIRKIHVAGVIVEVVRQETRIIYRLQGNMPVSSLTAEQRIKVMEEIQRLRNSGPVTPTNAAQQTDQSRSRSKTVKDGADGVGSAESKHSYPYMQSSQQIRPAPRLANAKQRDTLSRPLASKQEAVSTHSRPRPSLPNIAPRPLGADNKTATPPRSAPLRGSLDSPDTTSQPRSATPLNKSSQQQSNSSSPATTQRSTLERMYQSAYLKLLGGPVGVLRKLNPPVELGSLLKNKDTGGSISIDERTATAPAMLLQILKSLTKAQAAQLAGMYDRELKSGRRSLEISTSGLRGLGTASQPQSGESSPVAGSISGSEFDGTLDAPGSGATAPTKRRNTGRFAKSVAKRRSVSTSEPASGTASPTRDDKQTSTKVLSYAHKDMVRHTLAPLAERRKRPNNVRHEAEIGKRFREALAMDHQMVRNPDWRTPFSDTRDIVQRLLPFHVFQYPDAAIDGATRQLEAGVDSSTGALGRRLANISARYNGILERDASVEGFYRVDDIQLEMSRIYDATDQFSQLEEERIQLYMSLAEPSTGKQE
ncbi:hypothetical protein GGH99_004482 [Coemansia sp. RSA 1285]|nr:hypothetical protein GGH99_004482 [Coemansia sp. RSA 1285]